MLWDAIKLLTPNQVRTLELLSLELSGSETGRVLGTNTGAVYTCLQRIRSRLRRHPTKKVWSLEELRELGAALLIYRHDPKHVQTVPFALSRRTLWEQPWYKATLEKIIEQGALSKRSRIPRIYNRAGEKTSQAVQQRSNLSGDNSDQQKDVRVPAADRAVRGAHQDVQPQKRQEDPGDPRVIGSQVIPEE